MQTVGLADLVDGAGRLTLDSSGVPVSPLVVVDLDGADWRQAPEATAALRQARSSIVVGISSHALPDAATALLEELSCTLSPGGPGRTWIPADPGALDAIAATVSAAPLASITLATLLGVTSRTHVEDGLVAESMAYSMLLSGPEFLAWRNNTPRRQPPADDVPVLLDRDDDVLSVILNRPERHNAFSAALRDGLVEAMELVATDPTIRQAVVTGNGPSFCSGGDLDEFGTTPSVSAAHLVRLRQSAGHAVHRVADRTRVIVHGACIGAGIEVPAFAGLVEARENARFLLPELAMGLVPGAGGTVSITRRIGRWRTAYLALLGLPIDVETALSWGLVDARA